MLSQAAHLGQYKLNLIKELNLGLLKYGCKLFLPPWGHKFGYYQQGQIKLFTERVYSGRIRDSNRQSSGYMADILSCLP